MTMKLMTKFFPLSLLFIFISQQIFTQNTPAGIQMESVLIIGGSVHTGGGRTIRNAAIGFEQGRITLIKDLSYQKIDSSKFDHVIYVKGQHIYPGFIAMNSTLGLMEIGAVRATKDYNETGEFNPNVRTLTSFNTDSRITPTVRSNGVLIGQISPRGGIISGTSSVMNFDSWNWEDAVIKKDDGIHLIWPRGYLKPKEEIRYNKQIEKINDFFNLALAYSKKDTNTKIDVRLHSMKGIFNGNKRLYISANEVDQIKDIIAFKKKYRIINLSIIGGRDAHYVPELLIENNISLIIRRTHSLPGYQQADINLPYQLPYLLHKYGVEFCFQNQGDMEQMQTRNLPFLAGTAVAYGLPYEEAIKALTATPAKLLGLENYGMIKEGYSATFFISKGDALDVLTNDLSFAFIDGREIDLSNEQSKNYIKYSKKYNLKVEK